MCLNFPTVPRITLSLVGTRRKINELPMHMRKSLLSISFTETSFPYRRFPFFALFLICGRQWGFFNGERKVHCTTMSLIAFLYNNSFALLSPLSRAFLHYLSLTSEQLKWNHISNKFTGGRERREKIISSNDFCRSPLVPQPPSKQNSLLKDLLNLCFYCLFAYL